MKASPQSRATLVLLGVGLLWGTSYLFIRVAVEEVSPLQLVLFRSLSGAALLLAWMRVRGEPLGLSRRNLALATMQAVVAAMVPFAMIAWAETRIDSGPAAVLNSTMPIFVILFAVMIYADEKLTLERAGGVVMGLLGVVVLVGGDLTELASTSLVASMAVLAATALYAIGAVLSRSAIRGWDAMALCTMQVTLVAVLSAPIVLVTGTLKLDIGLDTWLSLLALGFLGTGVAYVGYYWLIDNVGSVRASLVAYLIPITGVSAGAIVLDERLAWNTFAGAAVILLGVGIVNGGLRAVTRRRQVAEVPG